MLQPKHIIFLLNNVNMSQLLSTRQIQIASQSTDVTGKAYIENKKYIVKIDLGEVCLMSASGGRLANSPEGVDSG